jgi:hypothetical protein
MVLLAPLAHPRVPWFGASATNNSSTNKQQEAIQHSLVGKKLGSTKVRQQEFEDH